MIKILRKTYAFSAILTLLCSTLASPLSAAAQTANATGQTTLKIIVVDSATKKPIPNVRVNIPHTDFSGIDGVIYVADPSPFLKELQFAMSNYVKQLPATEKTIPVNLIPHTANTITVPLTFYADNFKGNNLLSPKLSFKKTPGTTALRITFIDSSTGEPIPNVGMVDGPTQYGKRGLGDFPIRSDIKGVYYYPTADPGAYGVYFTTPGINKVYGDARQRYFISIVKDYTTNLQIKFGPPSYHTTAGGTLVPVKAKYTTAVGTFRLNGHLIDSTTGKGIPNVPVNVTGSSSYTKTDANGNFTLLDGPGAFLLSFVMRERLESNNLYVVETVANAIADVTIKVGGK